MTFLPIIQSSEGAAWTDPADWHSFSAGARNYALIADGSRIYELDAATDGIDELDIPHHGFVNDEPLTSPPIRALSLAISQACNLACSYCYAQEGTFGGKSRPMSLEVAKQAVDLLFSDATAGDRVHLSFLGGEPLAARKTLQATVEYAQHRSQLLGLRVSYSLTTNGTLLTASDCDFLAEHRFAVTVSLDGVGRANDQLRFFKDGTGTFDTVVQKVGPLLADKRLQVTARVTVTPSNLELSETLTEFIGMGFHSVGFSPMLASPTGSDQMSPGDLDRMLEEMICCGQLFEENVRRGNRFPFSNMMTAMQELHTGTHRPYPCGAGAGYLGVSADGELSACHRFVRDESGRMGTLSLGVDPDLQNRWLEERHVHRQEPCRSCWARYLCGGGCHHEVLRRGRPSCNYIRGWLHYCLQAYVRLLEACPSYFEAKNSNKCSVTFASKGNE